jgi:uncharacterized protein YkwD/Mg-chelatase subunit ChlD
MSGRQRRIESRQAISASALLGCLLALLFLGELVSPLAAQAPEYQVGFTPEGDPFQGDPNAPVVLVEYSSFQCPFCARFAQEVLPQIQDQYIKTGKVLYILKDFPLSDWNLDAQAAACAGAQGPEAFWAMHDRLFAEQKNWLGHADAVDKFKSYAAELGLDRTAFEICLNSGDFAEIITSEKAAAVKRGIRGTPTFFINDQLLIGLVPVEVMASQIDAALAATSATSTSTVTPVGQTGLPEALPTPSFAQQVVELTNQERVREGLPPLKASPQLEQAALAHSRAMAEGDFQGHNDPATGSTPGDRVRAAGYNWIAVAENVAAGQDSPARVMGDWLSSLGHRENILNRDFREIGVGYVYDANDTFLCGDLPCHHYWTQNFGARQDVYPLIINNEAFSTTTTSVSLYLHGQGWAQEMRLRNDDGDFTPWEPFVSTRFWQLSDIEGERQVTVELRNGDTVLSASDTILLSRSPASAGPEPVRASDALNLERLVDPPQVFLGEEIAVKLTLSSTLDTCGRVVNRTPADIVLVIDRSSSMNDLLGFLFGGTKLDGAREAAKVFVDQVDLETERIGVVQFEGSASLLHPLDDDAAAIKAAIDTLSGQNSTAIHAGLVEAHRELTGSRHRTQASRVIVLLSDGRSDANAALEAAEAAKTDGIRIVTIGLGSDADQDLLRSLASTPQDYYFAPETAQLADIYRSVAQTIQEYAPISNLILKHTFDASNFELVPDSVDPAGEVGINTIIWKVGRLDKAPRDFTYRLRPRRPGSFNADRGDEITFLRCEQAPEGVSLGSGLPVLVQAPTQTPSPTPPVVPTPSPTSSLAPLPTPAPTPRSPVSIAFGTLCSGFPWWLLLAILLILALLWLILARNLAGLRSWLRDRRRWPRWCELIGLLTLAYLLFLLALALNQFLPLVCRPREAVYFWRIDANRNSFVMIKPIDPDLPARPMQELNQHAGCVACHVVSRRGSRIAAVADGSSGPVFVMGLDGRPVSIPSINASFLSWSPDGSKLAYSANDEDIYILDLVTGVTMPLAGASDPNVVETMPAWSSDGQTIAFVRPVSGSNGFQIDVPTDIYVVPATGGSPTLLAGASGNGFNYYPAYSPDGKWLAFTRHTQGKSTYADDYAEIYIVPATGGQPRRLAANDGLDGQPLSRVSNSWPTWSRDGQFLAFNSKRNGGQYDIFITRIDANGNSGPAEPLLGANEPTAFEHLPFWGEPPHPNVLASLLGLWPWLLPIPLLLLLARWLCQRLPPPPDTLHLERKVNPTSGRLGRDEFTVQLSLIGDSSLCREVRKRKPVDVALVIDVSGSMGEELGASFAGTKLDGAKRAAKTFVDQLDLSQDRVTIIPFSDDAQVVLPLDNDLQRIKNAVDTLSVLGGTSIHAGLGIALQALTGPARRSEAEPAIVLLSDGESEAAPAEGVATAARDAGIRVITIGLGAKAGQGLLQSIASQPSDYYFSPDAGSLADIYRSIAETILQPVPATEVELEHTFDATNFELIPGSVFPPPTQIGTGTLIWRLDHVGIVQRHFRYRLRPLNAGAFDVAQGDQIHYLRCGEEPRTLHYGVGLPVTIHKAIRPELPRRLAPKPPPEPLPIRPPEVIWQPDEALVIGVGGTGRWVLTHLKKNLRDAGAGRLPDQVRMIVIDTSEYELINNQQVPVEFAGAEIEPADVLVLDENLGPLIARMVQDNQAELDLQDWFPASDYHGLAEPQKNLAQGTHGRRPLARAGLVREIQQGTDDGGSRLWQLLTEAMPQVKGRHGVRVILVGSLAGGMSGTLFDVAYLARRAARVACGEDVSVTIEAYLALDSVFAALAADPPGLAANTFAALRELRRFQLNPGVAYPMRYRGESDDPVLAGACDWRLLDDVFLFGEQIAIGTDPRTGAFPAIADIITLRLDRASQGAGPADWNNDMRNAVDAYQRNRHELAVGTAGSFVYRLPAYDIMEEVKTRWVRALVQMFLVGDDSATLRLDPALARDPGLTWEPAELVPIFLDGLLQTEPANRGLAGASALLCLMEEQADERLDIGLREADQQDEGKARQAFEEELAYALELILGGTDQATLNQARVGKLGYALAFLDALVTGLDEVETAVEGLVSDPNADAERKRQARKLQVVRAEYQIVAEAYRTALRQVARAISRTIMHDHGGPDGLYDALDKRAAQIQNWRRQMDDIRVRQYLWTLREQTGVTEYIERELADIWYLDYAKDDKSPERYVEHLAWEVQTDGSITLTLRAKVDDKPTRIHLRTPEDVSGFLQALLDMAGSILQDAWQAHTLAEAMASHDLLDVRGVETADRLRKIAGPILTLDPVRAGGAPHRAVVGATDRFQEQAQRILQELQSRPVSAQAQAVEPLTTLATTDRFACQLIRTVDAVPLDAIERLLQGMDNAQDRYLRDNQRRVVFPAEVHAEEWERRRRVSDDGMGRLVLHPLVVAGLNEPERARVYALALAGDMVRQDGAGISLVIPGQSEKTLVRVVPQGVDPLVMGLLAFTLHTSPDLVEAVTKAVTEPDPDLIRRWQSLWVDRVPRELLEGSDDRKDLGRLTRLVVRYELARRFRQ